MDAFDDVADDGALDVSGGFEQLVRERRQRAVSRGRRGMGFLDGRAGLVFCQRHFAHDSHIVAKMAERKLGLSR